MHAWIYTDRIVNYGRLIPNTEALFKLYLPVFHVHLSVSTTSKNKYFYLCYLIFHFFLFTQTTKYCLVKQFYTFYGFIFFKFEILYRVKRSRVERNYVEKNLQILLCGKYLIISLVTQLKFLY